MNNRDTHFELIPGKSFTKSELIKRINLMGTECGPSMGPKSFYNQLYDRLVHSPEKQKMIIDKLLADNQRSLSMKRTLKEAPQESLNLKTTMLNDYEKNEETGRKGYEEIPPYQKYNYNTNHNTLGNYEPSNNIIQTNVEFNNYSNTNKDYTPTPDFNQQHAEELHNEYTNNKFTLLPGRKVPNSTNNNPLSTNSYKQFKEDKEEIINTSKPQDIINPYNQQQQSQVSKKPSSAFMNPSQLPRKSNTYTESNNQEGIYISSSINPNQIKRKTSQTIPIREFNPTPIEEEESNIYFSEKQTDSSNLNLLYTGATSVLGLFILFIVIYTFFKKETPAFLFLLNPIVLLRDFFIPSLGRWGRRIFIDYLWLTILVVIFSAISCAIYFKKKKQRILNEIFQDIKQTLMSMNDDEEGLPENEIINKYSMYYQISREVFEREYMPILRDMRRRDINLKLADGLVEGRKQVFWYWNK